MLCSILWQGDPITVLCTGEGSDVEITATPVVASYWFGITPGLFFTQYHQFGWWYSSNITDVLTAWRVARLLPLAKRLRERSGYDQTLCSLVIQLRGDDHTKRRENLADDFGVSVDEMTIMLADARQTGPGGDELEAILEKMQEGINESGGILKTHLDCIERAEAAGIIQFTPRSLELVEAARDRRRANERQLEADEKEIEAPIDPEQSITQLLTDLGIQHLAYSFFDDWAPSHVELATFDRFVKEHCIGRSGFYDGSVPLVVTEKGPDDPTAHYSSTTTDGSMTIFGSNFGEAGPLVGDIGEHRLILHSVRYERGGKYWVKMSRRDLPSDMDVNEQKDAVDITVQELRWLIGSLLGFGPELPPGTRLELPATSAPAKGFKRLLHRGN